MAQVDALGFRSTAVYDAASRAVASVDALANRWSTSYHALGRAVAQEDPLGNRSTSVYDPRGLAVESIDPLGHVTTSVFDAARQAVAGIDPLGNRSTVEYDPAGRVLAQVSALGYRTTPGYDAASRQVETQDALGYRWTTVYDAADRAVAALDPLGNRSTTGYDALGRPQFSENALGRRNTTVYDSLGRGFATVDPRGYRATQVYDPLGQRLAVQNANGGRWSSSYDARGSEITATDPLGVPTTNVFDPTGNRTLRTDGRGWVTTYGFDALGRETTRLYRDGSRVTHGFDMAGRLSQMGDSTGNTGYAWDAASRRVAVQYPTGLNLTYGYDPASNRTTLQDKTGVTTYGYDSQNRVTAIENPYGERTTVTWDALNREQHKTLGNGMTVSHGYDPAGREWLIENRKATGEAVGVFTGTYDSVGNRLTVRELDGTRVTYGYDPSDQLVYEARDGASGYFASYSYDGVGNRLQKLEAGGLTAYEYNVADELLLVTPPTGAPTTSTWDRMGNLETETTGSAVTTYTWDSENMLVRVLSPTEDEVYRYGGDLKRRSKESGGATTQFTWDGENLLFETDGSLAVQARYTDWPGYWGGLASQRRTDSNFYGFDLQWSTRVLVSIGGSVTDSYAFRAFGEEAAQSGATVNPFRYVGLFGYQVADEQALLVRRRTLRALTARWLSRDPEMDWGDSISPGLYTYVENWPTGSPDPSGLKPPIRRPPIRFPCPPICPNGKCAPGMIRIPQGVQVGVKVAGGCCRVITGAVCLAATAIFCTPQSGYRPGQDECERQYPTCPRKCVLGGAAYGRGAFIAQAIAQKRARCRGGQLVRTNRDPANYKLPKCNSPNLGVCLGYHEEIWCQMPGPGGMSFWRSMERSLQCCPYCVATGSGVAFLEECCVLRWH